MHKPSRAHLAAYAQMSPEPMLACSRALARHKELRAELCANPNLPSLVWRQMWDKQVPVALAQSLVSRPLNQPDRELVIAQETRVRVLAAFLRHNTLPRSEQDVLVRKAAPGTLEVLLQQAWLADDLRTAVAKSVAGLPLLKEMAYGPLSAFGDDEIQTLMETMDVWLPEARFRERSQALKAILARRPGLVEFASTQSNSSILTAAASVFQLTEAQVRRIASLTDATSAPTADRAFALLALVSNPTVSRSLAEEIASATRKIPGLEQVATNVAYRKNRPDVVDDPRSTSDPEELRWLLSRALPSEYHDGRLWELAALAVNPHLSADDRGQVIAQLQLTARQDWQIGRALASDPALERALGPCSPENERTTMPESTWAPIAAFCKLAEASLGADPAKWEVLVGLLDEYEGTAVEVIELAAQL